MISPVDSAFVSGSLMLPSTPSHSTFEEFAASPVTDIVSLISLVVCITVLRRLIDIFPSLATSLIRWKESQNIFSSIRLSRDRSAIALSLVIPFCLLVTRYGLYSPSFLENFGTDARFGMTTGIFITYLILRACLEKVCAPNRRNKQTYWCGCRSADTFFILLTLFLLASGGIFHVFNVDPEVARSAMLWLSAVIYAIFLLRKTQIFTSSCSIFTAFLYLCALEILPTGALIASAVIL